MDIYRPLGHLEYTYWLMDFAFRTNFTIWARIHGRFNEALLSEAMGFIQASHPLLNVGIVYDPKAGPVFRVANNPTRISIKEAPDDPHEFCAIITDEHQRGFDVEKGPLMRALLLQHGTEQFTIILTFHHAAADALSAVSVLQGIFTRAQQIISGQLPDNSPIPETGPLERYSPLANKGFRAIFKMMGYSARQNILRPFLPTDHLPTDQDYNPDTLQNRFILNHLEPDQTIKLIRRTRLEGVTVHGALCAAQLRALLEEHPGKDRIRPYLVSLLDLRKHIPSVTHEKMMNLMVSMAESRHLIDRTGSFWDLARDIRTAIEKRIQTGFHWWCLPTQSRMIYLGRFARKHDVTGSRKLLRQGRRLRPPAMPVSNIGRIAMARDYAGFSVTDVAFVLSLSASGLIGSAINTFNDRLHWNFTYAAPAVTKDQAMGIVENSRNFLLANL